MADPFSFNKRTISYAASAGSSSSSGSDSDFDQIGLKGEKGPRSKKATITRDNARRRLSKVEEFRKEACARQTKNNESEP